MMKDFKYGHVILYGAGDWGQKMFAFISANNHVISWIDRNYQKCLYGGKRMAEDIESLKNLDDSQWDKLLIAVINKKTADSIKMDLIQKYHLKEEKIIWLYDAWIHYVRKSRQERLSVRTLEKVLQTVPSIQQPGGQELIKVRVCFAGGEHLWNSMKSVCCAFERDNRFHLLVILQDCLSGNRYDSIRRDVRNIVLWEDYRIEEDRPEIFLMNPHAECGKENLQKIRAYAGYVCSIPFVLIKNQMDIRVHAEVLKKNLDDGQMDSCILDRLLYEEMAAEKLLDNRMVEIGNPKFDSIFEKVHLKPNLPENWKKLNGKKVILWTTDHIWFGGNITCDLYFGNMIEYFNKNQDMALIFRPHPLYIRELIDNGIWSEDDLKIIRESFENSKNLIFDDTPDYSLAYAVSDGILSDVNCGITVSALPLGKPLGVLRRFDGELREDPLYPKVIRCLYQIDSLEELKKFLDMVKAGEDYRKEERDYAFSHYISHFDGENGLRIKKYVVSEYKKVRENQYRVKI